MSVHILVPAAPLPRREAAEEGVWVEGDGWGVNSFLVRKRKKKSRESRRRWFEVGGGLYRANRLSGDLLLHA